MILPLLAGTLVVALVVTGLLALRGGGLREPAHPGRAEQSADSTHRLGATKWRLATFNVLGSGHTKPGNERGFESGVVRMGYSVKIINREALSLVGFQEMRLDQYDEFNRLTGTGWDIWPQRPARAGAFPERHIANSLAWRTDTWTAVRREVEPIRYINDESTVDYPVVWLRHRLTGQTVIAANFHNVSNVHDDSIEGGAAARRAEEVRAQIALANRLRAENPDVPVLFTGDFNERETFFCKIVANTALRAANGGWATSTGCKPPPSPLQIDWILGSAPATLSGWTRIGREDPLVAKTTDHPIILAQAYVPPASAVAPPIDRVVLLSVEGLRAKTVAGLGAAATGFDYLRRTGASTSNARTIERPLSLSNVTSMLTGKPISTSISGHGVVDGTTASTVHRTAGRYATSVLDLVHDNGMSTAVFTNDAGASILDRSWNATNGAPDLTWTDQGRDKISSYSHSARSGGVARKINQSLSGSPATFTYGQLSGPDVAGHTYGFGSEEYHAAVVRAARQVQSLVGTIDANPLLRGRTLVIVAGEHGGKRKSHTSSTVLANMRVPLYVRGPGVPAGADLYAMNPDYVNPGRSIPGYHGGQPIRPALVANLITAAFGLPAIPGSTMNTQQNFTAFRQP